MFEENITYAMCSPFKDDIQYTDLRNLVYLEQCLQESLRLYPPAAR